MSTAMNRKWVDSSGESFTVTSSITDQLWHTARDVDNNDVIDALQNNVPVLYATTDHAMVLVSVTYLSTPSGPLITEGTVWDPNPIYHGPGKSGLRRVRGSDLVAQFVAIPDMGHGHTDRSVPADAETDSTAPITPLSSHPSDPQIYLPLDQVLPKWAKESSNDFSGNKLVNPDVTYATPGFDYLGDKRQCEITDQSRHQCIFALYGGTDSEVAQSHYSRLDEILAAALPDWSTSDIPGPIDAAGGAIKILRKRTRSKGHMSYVLDKEVGGSPNDVLYYMVDLTFIWSPD